MSPAPTDRETKATYNFLKKDQVDWIETGWLVRNSSEHVNASYNWSIMISLTAEKEYTL